MRLLVVFILLFSVGCAKESSEPAATESIEVSAIFKVWESGGMILDLTGVEFNTGTPFEVEYGSGAVCRCFPVTFVGNEDAGTIDVAACVNRTGGLPDPGCNDWINNGNQYTYTRASGVLEICGDNGCTQFNEQ